MELLIYPILQLKKWKNNVSVILSFILLIILCLTVTDEYVQYAKSMGFTIGIFEPFILMFTQKFALISITLIFLLIFNDVPFLDRSTPYSLIRGSRLSWVLGQLIYVFITVIIFITTALIMCALSGFALAYPGNVWSQTAWYSANGGALNQSAPIPMVLIENTTPFYSVICIYILTLLSVNVITSALFVFNLWKGKYYGLGAVTILIFSGYITSLGVLSKKGLWFSIIAHSNLALHSFGEEINKPTVIHSVVLMLIISAVLYYIAWRISKKYPFFQEQNK